MPRCIKEKSGKQEKNRTMHFICLMCGAARWMKGGDFLKTTKLSEGRRSTWQKFQHHTSASISGAKWWWHIGRHVITPQLCASLRIVGILILRTNILMLYQPLAQCFRFPSSSIPNLVTVHCVGFNLNHTWPSHLTYLGKPLLKKSGFRWAWAQIAIWPPDQEYLEDQECQEYLEYLERGHLCNFCDVLHSALLTNNHSVSYKNVKYLIFSFPGSSLPLCTFVFLNLCIFWQPGKSWPWSLPTSSLTHLNLDLKALEDLANYNNQIQNSFV